ncbi:enoyl-CoA hydratase/isomerase family protein [Acuticoccus sp. M5D2P5]|uniref:enoyl-CoA hydratase/isomerase family protein n=1 Tax=Acuticoccus kalidii TaxID=2910977 RepID=UPI001F2EDF03|nr:enoyl-CoA hydratase/isomerase family protein [Acuticoccus kalidii]MCF3936344.1 enoyl-CoA hydratase/isomerase family protein [Acuticoccus kalidii]
MSDILFDTVGRAGIVTLNRASALNALTEPMVRELGDALDEWERDDRVERVAIRAEGKAFCAGGDLRDVFERRASATPFFATEYCTNHRIGTYKKPVIALIDGICMGGGVGISVHGSHRVASEKLVFAMPETAVGLFPDVGASHILSELEGETGLYLGLTGARLGRDAAAEIGIVTHPTDASRMGDALDRVAHGRDLDGGLDELKVETEPRDPDEIAVIDEAFSAGSVREILDRLDATEGAFSDGAAKAIRTMSPTSLEVTFREIRRAKGESLAACLTMEYRIVCQILEGHDLFEGIRAILIDKDRNPHWSPATLEAVEKEAIDQHFKVPHDGDLLIPGAASR